jgi:hypothetical protein
MHVLVIRKEATMATTDYGKPKHTGRHLNHSFHVIRSLIQSLHNRAPTICQEGLVWFKEINSLRSYLQLSGYPQGFLDSVINSKGSSRLNKEQKPLGSVYIPYVKGVSETFKRTGNRCNIRTIFKTKHNLSSSLMKTRPEREPVQMAQWIYSIPCECGRSYTGETGRPLAVRLREHRHNLKDGLLEKSKLAYHAHEENIW